jgi:hypothetical protein
MGQPAAKKLAVMARVLDMLAAQFEVVPMREHAAAAYARLNGVALPAPAGVSAAGA